MAALTLKSSGITLKVSALKQHLKIRRGKQEYRILILLKQKYGESCPLKFSGIDEGWYNYLPTIINIFFASCG